MIPFPLLAAAFRGAGLPLLRRFEAALRDPAKAQARCLREILSGAAGTGYGRSRLDAEGFAQLARASDEELPQRFAEAFPECAWRDVEPWAARQREREDNALSPGTTLCYEPTSGSGGAAKLIPYNRALKGSFDALFRLWALDVLAHGPGLRTGKVFFSASPGLPGPAATPRGVPIGFPDDRSYLGSAARLLTGPLLLDGEPLKRLSRGDEYLTALALILLSDPDLEILSVWSPTYLMAVLDRIAADRPGLARLLETRAVRLSDVTLPVRSLSPRRRDALLSGAPWTAIWPRLRLVSCWAHGQAKMPARALADVLPGVAMQPKGLLATEAPVTLPWIRSGGHVPLLTEVYLEFADANGRVHGLSDLEEGAEYRVLVTQKGGLLRYGLGDRVRAGARHRSTPTLEFLGRADERSDLAGEKLDPGFLAGQVTRALPGLSGAWVFLPLRGPSGPSRYAFAFQDPALDPRAAESLLEDSLAENPHYRQCRRAGQLAALEAVHVPDLPAAWQRHAIARGIRWGDLKGRILVPDPDEAAAFPLPRTREVIR